MLQAPDGNVLCVLDDKEEKMQDFEAYIAKEEPSLGKVQVCFCYWENGIDFVFNA
jgi:hypothetical protein